MRGKRDTKARDVFLAALRGGATVTAAVKAAGLSRQAPYNWVKRGDAEVAKAMGIRGASRLQERAEARPNAPVVAPEVPKPPPGPTYSNEDLTNRARSALAGLLGDEDPKIRAEATKIVARHFRRTEELEPAAEPEGDDGGELDAEDAAARFRMVD